MKSFCFSSDFFQRPIAIGVLYSPLKTALPDKITKKAGCFPFSSTSLRWCLPLWTLTSWQLSTRSYLSTATQLMEDALTNAILRQRCTLGPFGICLFATWGLGLYYFGPLSGRGVSFRVHQLRAKCGGISDKTQRIRSHFSTLTSVAAFSCPASTSKAVARRLLAQAGFPHPPPNLTLASPGRGRPFCGTGRRARQRFSKMAAERRGGAFGGMWVRNEDEVRNQAGEWLSFIILHYKKGEIPPTQGREKGPNV